MSEASEKEEGRMRVMRDTLWYRKSSQGMLLASQECWERVRYIFVRGGHTFSRGRRHVVDYRRSRRKKQQHGAQCCQAGSVAIVAHATSVGTAVVYSCCRCWNIPGDRFLEHVLFLQECATLSLVP